MKYEIMLGILFDLLSKKTVTATYLAEKYEVSKRSIYRYLNSLEMAGVPLYTNRGKGGGICIVDTYKFSSTFMTVDEFDKVISTLTAIEQNVPDKKLESAINKLKATIKNEYSGFDIRRENLIIDAGPWGDTVGYKSKLIVLQKAIEGKKILSIKYHDRNGEKTDREIEPYVIVFKQGLWYVYAYCHLRNDFRFFKTGRIELANITDKTFEPRKLPNKDLSLDFWHQNVLAERITLEIDKSVLSDVEEWLGVENVSYINGKNIAEASLPFDNGLVSKIMSFGKGVKVISPKKLAEQIKQNAQEIIKKYE